MLVHTDFVDDVRGLDIELLVIVGDKDPGLDEAAMRRTFRPASTGPPVGGAELRALSDAGVPALLRHRGRGLPARRGPGLT